MDRYRFNADYREEVSLRDGSRVRFRLLRPEDDLLLVRGFERLSAESRYRRFLTPKPMLSPEEVRFLTRIDGVTHVAVGAGLVLPNGEEEGLGVARFVRLRDEPDVAEPAVAVTDDFQQRGLGRLLLDRLVAAANERGIRRFRFDVLTSNTPVLALVRNLSPTIVRNDREDEATIEVMLPRTRGARLDPRDGSLAIMRGLLALAAQGVLLLFSRTEPPADDPARKP
jgi:ribosomal protein S18 acetylase RimI-like enzyme